MEKAEMAFIKFTKQPYVTVFAMLKKIKLKLYFRTDLLILVLSGLQVFLQQNNIKFYVLISLNYDLIHDRVVKHFQHHLYDQSFAITNLNKKNYPTKINLNMKLVLPLCLLVGFISCKYI